MVVAIITILTAISLPVVGQVQALSKSATCQSNLRQIGVALALYRSENDGVMPKIYDATTTYYWFHQLLGPSSGAKGAGYLTSPKVLSCPAQKNGPITFGTIPPTSVNYGMLDAMIWFPTAHRSQDDTRLYSRIQNLSNWPVVMDADKGALYSLDNPTATAAGDSRFTARHRNLANVLMADGHIEMAAYGDMRWKQQALNDLIK